jgi:hypothetical protein
MQKETRKTVQVTYPNEGDWYPVQNKYCYGECGKCDARFKCLTTAPYSLTEQEWNESITRGSGFSLG